MNKELNELFSSPKVKYSNYECSPIISLENYKAICKIVNEVNSDCKNIINQLSFPNKHTPHTQENKKKVTYDIIKDIESFQPKEENTTNVNKVTLQNINPLNSIIQSYIKNMEKSKLAFKKLNTVISSFNLNDVNSIKTFRLDEVIINGKTINALLDEDIFEIKEEFDEIQKDVMFVCFDQQIYEDDFKSLNLKGENNKNLKKKIELPKNLNFIITINKYKKIFKQEIKSTKLFIGEYYEPSLFYKKILKDFKDSLKNLKKAFSQKAMRKTLILDAVEKLQDVNYCVELLLYCEKIYNSTLKETNKTENEIFECKICHKILSTGQGLGGHMSRSHPNSSEMYIEKINRRKSRSHLRNLVYSAKREILKLHNYNYDELIEAHQKKLIKKIIEQNRFEYKSILNRIKAEFQDEMNKK